jgi:hypothetical protein
MVEIERVPGRVQDRLVALASVAVGQRDRRRAKGGFTAYDL